MNRIYKTNSPKKKILIVHNYYQIPGGEDTVVANEQNLLSSHGHKVVLYSRNNSELMGFSKIQKVLLPFTTVFSFKTYKEVKRVIKEQKIDIVHVHNTLSLISPSVYYAASSCGVPVVQSIHNFRLLCAGATFYREDEVSADKDGVTAESSQQNNSVNQNNTIGHICEDCLTRGLGCSLKHKCYRDSMLQTLACVVNLKVHRILGTYRRLNYVCLTEFNKKKLLELNEKKQLINPERVYIKPNFVNINIETVPFYNRKNQYIFVGRLDKLKGIQLLLEAWKFISRQDSNSVLNLLICGTGPMEEYCQNYIKDNNLTNITMVGFIPNDTAMKHISESKALILPTQWYEGFPMTIVECMACGTAIIGSNNGNTGSLIEEGVTGTTFQFDSVEDLINAVKRVDEWYAEQSNTDNHMDCQDFCKSIRNYYDEHYTAEMNYQTLAGIYEKASSSNQLVSRK